MLKVLLPSPFKKKETRSQSPRFSDSRILRVSDSGRVLEDVKSASVALLREERDKFSESEILRFSDSQSVRLTGGGGGCERYFCRPLARRIRQVSGVSH